MLVANLTTEIIVKTSLRALLLLLKCIAWQYYACFGVDSRHTLLERQDKLSTKTLIQKFIAATTVKTMEGCL